MSASSCACKGIRTCKTCSPTKDYSTEELTTNNIVFIYCDACRQAIRMDIYESNSQCPHHTDIGNSDISFPLDGVCLISDFLTEDEEIKLLNMIDNDIWVPSQSGRLKQDFGIKINFKKQTIKTKYFTGMPLYSKEFLERFRTHRILNDFQSVELCNLDYNPERGSHIDSHLDDIWIWGERLVTINLLSNTILSLTPNDKDFNRVIYVPIPRRWVIVLYGDARYEYKHAIQSQHITSRRIATTFRELTSKNEKFYEENKDLYERILRIGKRFTGISVGRFEKIVNDVNTVMTENMDVDVPSVEHSQLKELFESISTIEPINSVTYLIYADNKYLVKLFSHLTTSLEQLQQFLSTCPCNGNILNRSINQSHVVVCNYDDLSSNKILGRLLAQWRLYTRTNMKFSYRNPFDTDWFNQQYASVVNKKKLNYPFLLSNLFTCQQELSSLENVQLEYGLLWMNNQSSYYLMDLVLLCLTKVHSFIDNVKEIVGAYEEIIKLTNDEINHLDTFVRLQMVVLMNHNDNDDEKYFDLLEQLCSNVCFVQNLIR